MRQIHRMTLKMLPGPFVGWLSLLMFVLVMQFLIKYLPDLVGKGLPFAVIMELIMYNLAYMLVLAVPMAVLTASVLTFQRLSETGANAMFKAAGISFIQLVWPVLLVGLLLAAVMGYFNSVVLPEANFRASVLWNDIRATRPGFALKPGVFYDWLDEYKILVRNLPPDRPDYIEDVTIYDYTDWPSSRTDIKAEYGTIRPTDGGRFLSIELRNGEIHRKSPSTLENGERYERLSFDRHRLRIETPDLGFSRSDPSIRSRTDRTMTPADLRHLADSLRAEVVRNRSNLSALTLALGTREETSAERNPTLPDPSGRPVGQVATDHPALAGLDSVRYRQVHDRALQDARAARSLVERARNAIERSGIRADQLWVEVHKKYSIALACLIFVLMGAPIGLSIRRGGITVAALVAIGVFVFYWVTLVNGEKLADRGLLEPWIGMWGANLVGGTVGLWLTMRVALDRGATPTWFSRLRGRLFPIPEEPGEEAKL